MSSHKSKLLSSTFMPVVLGASVAMAAAIASTSAFAKPSTGLENPAAVSKSLPGTMQVAQCKAKKCGACNPCKAKKGCNPCAGKKGCNPCAGKKGCNPCAGKKGCNPCAGKKK